MKTIILLCGNNESGKTNTLKQFFKVGNVARLKPMQVLERTLKGKKFFAVSLSSPQEQEDFCKYEEVIINIQRRFKVCDDKNLGEDYILVIPFGIYKKSPNETKLNEECLVKPVEWMHSLGIRVIGIYLKKETAELFKEKDAILRKITKYEILSNQQYSRQAKEIENILSSLL